MTDDEFFDALARGERVNRHDYDMRPTEMIDLENLRIIERDAEGYYVRGPHFELHTGLFNDEE